MPKHAISQNQKCRRLALRRTGIGLIASFASSSPRAFRNFRARFYASRPWPSFARSCRRPPNSGDSPGPILPGPARTQDRFHAPRRLPRCGRTGRARVVCRQRPALRDARPVQTSHLSRSATAGFRAGKAVRLRSRRCPTNGFARREFRSYHRRPRRRGRSRFVLRTLPRTAAGPATTQRRSEILRTGGRGFQFAVFRGLRLRFVRDHGWCAATNTPGTYY